VLFRLFQLFLHRSADQLGGCIYVCNLFQKVFGVMVGKKSVTAVLALLLLIVNFVPAYAADGILDEEYGKLSGQIRSFYFWQGTENNNGNLDKSKETFAVGGQLKYETPWLADHFAAAMNLFWAAPLFDDLNQARYGNTGVLDKNNDGYAVIGEAYLTGRFGGTTAKVWRQRIESPYLNGNDSRMVPNTFEAYGVESKDIEGLKIHLAWVDKIKLRDSDRFVSMTEAAGANSKKGGLAMLGAEWQATEGTLIKGWNYYAPDLDNTLFIEVMHKREIYPGVEGRIRFQAVDQRDVGTGYLGSYQTNEAGLLFGASYKGFNFDFGGTIVDDSAKIKTPWGVNPFFNMMMVNAFNRAGEKTLFLSATYDFSQVGIDGFTTNFKAALGSTPDSGANASADNNEYNLNLTYKFSGALEGFSILNRWAYVDSDNSQGGDDAGQVRVRLQYNF